jgi:tryptophan-rich sensory protein
MYTNLIISSGLVLLTAFLGRIFTKKSVNTKWYENIKSQYTPPNYVFSIIWTILYLFLIISLKKILDNKNIHLISIFIFNLLLNISWTYLYFDKKDINSAFINIILLIITSIYIYIKTPYIQKLYLFYVLWLGFAGFLNYDSINKKNNIN